MFANQLLTGKPQPRGELRLCLLGQLGAQQRLFHCALTTIAALICKTCPLSVSSAALWSFIFLDYHSDFRRKYTADAPSSLPTASLPAAVDVVPITDYSTAYHL